MNRDNINNNERDQDEDFPGYPHYPAQEDITRPDNNNGKINVSNDISIPELNDIPGQANITPAPLGGIGDTTVSSADEEDIVNGDSLARKTNDEDDLDIVMGTDADVTAEDLRMLGSLDDGQELGEDEDADRQGLDDTDDDGERLNESLGGDLANTGADLDVPGSEADDADEATGNEDEENNYYSLDKNEDDTEGNP